MPRNYSSPTPPKELTSYLEEHASPDFRYRQRAVLVKHQDGTWHLACCVVQAFSAGNGYPEQVSSRRYDEALLFEDWLDADDCRQLISDLQSGTLWFDDLVLTRAVEAHWQTDFHSSTNYAMSEAGVSVSTRFEEKQINLNTDFLVKSGLPYYPSAEDAARDWLPVKGYHGHSDARNQHVLFLLPEFRAYIANTSWLAGTLEVDVDGSDARENRPLAVKGSWHVGNSVNHFDEPVVKGKAFIRAAREAQRFRFILTNPEDRVFDSRDMTVEQPERVPSLDFSGSVDEEIDPEDYGQFAYADVPAADRFVQPDHNSKPYKDVMERLDQLIAAVQAANDYEDAEDKEQRLAELSAGQGMLKTTRVRVRAVWSVLGATLLWLTRKFAEGIIGELGKGVLEALRNLLHM